MFVQDKELVISATIFSFAVDLFKMKISNVKHIQKRPIYLAYYFKPLAPHHYRFKSQGCWEAIPPSLLNIGSFLGSYWYLK
jgi:hypothetical protein